MRITIFILLFCAVANTFSAAGTVFQTTLNSDNLIVHENEKIKFEITIKNISVVTQELNRHYFDYPSFHLSANYLTRSSDTSIHCLQVIYGRFDNGIWTEFQWNFVEKLRAERFGTTPRPYFTHYKIAPTKEITLTLIGTYRKIPHSLLSEQNSNFAYGFVFDSDEMYFSIPEETDTIMIKFGFQINADIEIQSNEIALKMIRGKGN